MRHVPNSSWHPVRSGVQRAWHSPSVEWMSLHLKLLVPEGFDAQKSARRCHLISDIRLNVDSSLFALVRSDRRWSIGEWIHATAGLRKGDDVTDGVGSGQQSADAVPSKSDPAVRRRAVVERLQQEAELFLCLVLRQPHYSEHTLLNVPTVDTDRAAADLIAVADDVVRVRKR